ncbi:hypothetical protein ADINL_0044 [Nitrincola lacisaponensis]|uniref:Winged helix-turn-helix domain-containing protein n=1 Tax=Nitrincola lacisaponensis TaxID=267850 RepID=A0A063Y6P2_9GAMM|nr:helix-turn-helix domain-containing protein [Nitrincola lacisaponensis]KDE41364.1 hypothetical protein ADINL_0044 [Nitrincola lacisaponensis]
MTDTYHSTDLSLTAQRSRLLKHFVIIGHVSTIEARDELNIMHPAGRVMELRDAGFIIPMVWEWQDDHNGRPHKIGRYHYFGARACLRKRLAEVLA